MMHAELLARLLPLSIDPNGPEISIELAAEGAALDQAQLDAEQILLEADPRTATLTLADWERTYGLPEACDCSQLMTLGPGRYAYAKEELESFSRAGEASYIDDAGVMCIAPADVLRLQDGALLIEPATRNRIASPYSDIDGAVGAMPINMQRYLNGVEVSTDVSIGPNGKSCKHTLLSTGDNNLGYFGTGTFAAGDVACATAYVWIPTGSTFPPLLFSFEGAAAVGATPIRRSMSDNSKTGQWQRIETTVQMGAAGSAVPVLRTAGAIQSSMFGQYFYTDAWMVDLADTPSSYPVAPDGSRAADIAQVAIPRSIQERRAALVAKESMQGGQRRQFYIDLAAALGYAITISEWRPYTTEMDSEYGVTDEAWAFVWQVNAPLISLREFTSDDDTEMPLAVWGNNALECVINRYKPSHTHVIFAYS